MAKRSRSKGGRRSGAADRMKKSRALAKAGKTRVPAILDDAAHIEGVLVRGRFLDSALMDSKEAIAAALLRLLDVLRATPEILGPR